jgi:hypothetical protein
VRAPRWRTPWSASAEDLAVMNGVVPVSPFPSRAGRRLGSTHRLGGGFGVDRLRSLICELLGRCEKSDFYARIAVEYRSRRIAAATATLRESTPGAMAILTSASQFFEATSPSPSNSLPITRATRW